jgi:hypothetical protein
MEEIEKHTHYDFRDSKNSAHSWEAFNRLSEFFQPVFSQLLIELISVILNPFLFLVIIPMKAGSIVEFIRTHSTNVPELGWICSFSVFDQDQARRSRPMEQKKKYIRSVSSFNRVYGKDAPLIEVVDEAEESVLAVRPTSPLVRMDFGPVDESATGTSDIIGHDGDPFFL